MTIPQIFIALILLLVISAAVWILVPSTQASREQSQPTKIQAPNNDQRYDTTGGQEMKPRWND